MFQTLEQMYQVNKNYAHSENINEEVNQLEDKEEIISNFYESMNSRFVLKIMTIKTVFLL